MNLWNEVFVEKTEYRYDLELLKTEVESIISDHNHFAGFSAKQIMLTHRDGSKNPSSDDSGKQPNLSREDLLSWQREFKNFHPRYTGTYLNHVWENFPFPVGRVRIMALLPYKCYSVHKDRQPRFHIPIETNPSCFMIYPNHPTWYHLPADGGLYKVQTWSEHSAMNGSERWRLHLVFDSLEMY